MSDHFILEGVIVSGRLSNVSYLFCSDFMMSSCPGVMFQAPEELAFPSYWYSLIHAISNPDFFAWQLCANEIITDANRNEIVVQHTRQEKNWKMLLAVEGRIKAAPSIFHRFVEVLRVQDDPVLRDIGQRLKDAYGMILSVYSQC